MISETSAAEPALHVPRQSGPTPVLPGPRGFFASLRNLLALRDNPPEFFRSLAREYGGAATFNLLGRRYHFFSDPDAIRDVLVVRAGVMQKGFLLRRVWELLKRIMGNGLLTSEGKFHDRQRRLIVPVFRRERLTGYATIMTDATRARTAGWIDGETRDLAAELSHLTLTIVARSLFGADVRAGAEAVAGALDTLMGMVESSRSPIDLLPFSPMMNRYNRAKAQLDRAVAGIIAGRRAQCGEDRGDLLSMLLLARDEETGEPAMSDQQVHDEVMTILLAGHETTAGALAWSFHLLGQHPEVEARLYAEVDAVLPDGQPPTLAELGLLVYTRQVFTETMRLYPPAWLLARQATEPVDVAGWKLPKGAMCILSPYATHRDPRWYAEPDQFLPERWSESEVAATTRPKHAYIPFGGGPRSCAAENFAWMEGTLLLADIARHWQFRPAPGSPLPTPLAAITLRPREGVTMVFHRRQRESTAGKHQPLRTCPGKSEN